LNKTRLKAGDRLKIIRDIKLSGGFVLRAGSVIAIEKTEGVFAKIKGCDSYLFGEIDNLSEEYYTLINNYQMEFDFNEV
jgi:hypothetical protein